MFVGALSRKPCRKPKKYCTVDHVLMKHLVPEQIFLIEKDIFTLITMLHCLQI